MSNDGPSLSAARFLARIRTGGWGWIVRRIAHEMRLPSTSLGKSLHRVARIAIAAGKAPSRRLKWRAQPRSAANETLYAFWDLQVAPITFDYLWFLCGAEIT